MSEFSERWSQLSKSERRLVRKQMLTEAKAQLTHKSGLYMTGSQLKAGAKKMVDMAIARASA